jgi:ABC-2 type transport system permease protein
VKKMLLVAAREFTATVLTRGFLFGIIVMPIMIGGLVYFLPRLITKAPPKMEGRIAVFDASGGAVAGGLAAYLAPEAFAERRQKARKRIEEATPEPIRRHPSFSEAGDEAMRQSIDAALGQVPLLQVTALHDEFDVEPAKASLAAGSRRGAAPDPSAGLAVVVLHPEAVRRAPGAAAFGSYDLFVRDKLDDRLIDDIHAGLRQAIVAARLEASGLDEASARGITHVDRPESRTVTAGGERETNEALNVFLPAAFMLLLLVSVLTSGQYLLTSTVEEKSTRVVEVLLSAVSAMELMTGKIIGQMGVGLLVLAIYAGLGIVALVSFATIGLVDPMMLVFLFVFYVLAYFTVASMMAAIGAAANEMREAQSLMTPVMLVMMVPWVLWLPISRDPNSTLAVVLSFVPPIGNFAMLLRMTSASPPPMWQAILSVLIGVLGVFAALWAASKVFRVGLLMFGKPPSLATLVRWVRIS